MLCLIWSKLLWNPSRSVKRSNDYWKKESESKRKGDIIKAIVFSLVWFITFLSVICQVCYQLNNLKSFRLDTHTYTHAFPVCHGKGYFTYLFIRYKTIVSVAIIIHSQGFWIITNALDTAYFFQALFLLSDPVDESFSYFKSSFFHFIYLIMESYIIFFMYFKMGNFGANRLVVFLQLF